MLAILLQAHMAQLITDLRAFDTVRLQLVIARLVGVLRFRLRPSTDQVSGVSTARRAFTASASTATRSGHVSAEPDIWRTVSGVQRVRLGPFSGKGWSWIVGG